MAHPPLPLEQLIKKIGEECIYKENSLIVHAQLSAINISIEMLEFTFKKLPSQGFTMCDIDSFSCSCVKEHINLYSNRVYMSLTNIEIFFEMKQVNAIRKLMSTESDVKMLTNLLQKSRQYP